MNTGTVELKFQDGTAIKIRGSADFVAAVTTAILEVSNEKSGEHIQKAEPKVSSQIGKLAYGDSVENHELEAPADHSPSRQPGWMNQKLCWSLKEAGERCGVSYLTLYRAACRGDLRIIKGFGRMMVSESELSRFAANVTEYLPRKRRKTCGARRATPEYDNGCRVRGDNGAS
jgi:hypothetical protein